MASPQSENEVRFKTETNLVLVPVVVRDAQGNAVGNLRKEDFQVFDKGKPQVITRFAVEDTSGQAAADRSVGTPAAGQAVAAPMAIPEHFVALLFDDVHMKIDDLSGKNKGYVGDISDMAYVREAGLKFLDTLQPADRVAIFTTSGQTMLDFTSDRAKLREALARLGPGAPVLPTVAGSGLAGRAIENETRAVIMESHDLVRRMASLPGQRTVVLVSPGLHLPLWEMHETMQLIEYAVRSRVVINSLDARGLAVSRAGDFQIFQAQVTNGTGGRYIRDTNDLDGAVRQLAATPKYIYVLGFSPETLKEDGSFHSLTVRLESGHKLDVQARKGYWAPDAKELARRQNQPVAAEKGDAPRVDETQTKDVAEAIGIAAAATQGPDLPEATLATAPAPELPKTKTASEAEVSTRDEPVTFKVQSNLVEVPVVVRDRQGHAIGSLRKDDFRVFEKGKRQEITKFSVQKAGGPLPHGRGSVTSDSATGGTVTSGSVTPGAPPALPNRFVAFLFDDVNIHFEDLPQVRAAVVKYLRSSLGPGDRVALYTTSGRIGVDFTDRPEAINEPLLKIVPNPIGPPVFGSCGMYVSYFQAVQIDQQVGLQPSAADVSKCLALRVAVEEFGDFHTAMQYVRDAYTSGLQETRAALAALRIVVQRMAAMPGQRSVVLVSPGFFVPPDLQNASSDLMELAIRTKVLVSSIDARGVWTIPAYDPCRPGAPASTIQDEVAFRQIDNDAATDELIALAEGTGGTANLNNDFDGGVRNAAAAPEYLYVLAFAPQNLKADGSFHPLKVTLNSGEKASVQARRGYWAPKRVDDALAASKQEIESAVFSREEIHDLPVEMHTQVTKAGSEAKLSVLTSVDLKLIHLRKADDRNRNDLTIVAAVFDANGNFITGTEKILQLRLRDETVRALEQRPPVTIDTNFNMQPGAFLVRLVVRDAEGQQLTAENAGVQIP
jgi:VWFA-related protein